MVQVLIVRVCELDVICEMIKRTVGKGRSGIPFHLGSLFVFRQDARALVFLWCLQMGGILTIQLHGYG